MALTVWSFNRKGFTLIEVLVAMLILVFVSIVLMETTETRVSHSRYLNEKILALWVAQDRIAEMRIAQRLGQPIELGDQLTEQAGQSFKSNAVVVKQLGTFQHIQVSVYNQSSARTPLYQIEASITRVNGAQP